MSGIAVAHRLKQAGLDVTILEKNADVGGTWFENTYPGCRVDVPSHLYSYSFAQTTRWPHVFSAQESLLDYFRWCADELGLRDVTRFNTEVLSADFDDEHQVWRVTARGGVGVHGDGRRVHRGGGDLQCRRTAQPSEVSRHQGNGALQGSVLPLGPLG